MALRAECFLLALLRTSATRPPRLIVFAFLRAPSWFFEPFVVKSGPEVHSNLADDHNIRASWISAESYLERSDRFRSIWLAAVVGQSPPAYIALATATS